MEYQVTLFDKSGKYRPVSAIVTTTETDIKAILKMGTEKICRNRGWIGADLKKYNYITGKVRKYDKERIAEEAAERYQKIKEEKYASGEWKRPKKSAKNT